jgi:hypothetical protein
LKKSGQDGQKASTAAEMSGFRYVEPSDHLTETACLVMLLANLTPGDKATFESTNNLQTEDILKIMEMIFGRKYGAT